MKNHRDVCSATEAGFITFKGLPGTIKTGCQLTPDKKSRYCSKHKPRVCVKPLDDITDACKVDKEEDVAEMILAERITRSATFYKVCMYVLLYLTLIIYSAFNVVGIMVGEARIRMFLGALR